MNFSPTRVSRLISCSFSSGVSFEDNLIDRVVVGIMGREKR